MPTRSTQHPSEAMLAKSLAKLWLHRLHESSSLKNLLCYLGLHLGAELDLQDLVSENKEVRFCRWCSKVKVSGVIY